MAYKALRNKVLRDRPQLINCTYKGKKWTSEGYIAINIDLFDGYKAKKSQSITEKSAILDAIIDHPEVKSYALAEFETLDKDGNAVLTSTATDKKYFVNKMYLELFKCTHPNAVAFVPIVEDRKTYYYPVQMRVGAEIVGAIMQLKPE
jgi:hypothetical protein